MWARITNVIFRIYLAWVLRKCGVKFRIGHSSHVKGVRNIEIGDRFFSGPFLYLNTNEISDVVIGNDVMMGPYVRIVSGNHVVNYKYGPMNSAPPKSKGADRGVLIADDVWVGIGATILDGARISEGAVIAAGSVVSGYVPPYVIAGGVPARVIRPRFSYEDLGVLLAAKRSVLSAEGIWDEYARLGIAGGVTRERAVTGD